MRVLDDAEHVAEGVPDGPDLHAAPDVLHRLLRRRAEVEESLVGGVGVGDPPVRNASLRPPRGDRGIRDEPELEAADVEADVEGLVEVGGDAERLGIPGLRPRQIGDGVLRRPQAEELGSANGPPYRP